MGNASTKEQRPPPARLRSSDARRPFSPSTAGPSISPLSESSERQSNRLSRTRNVRGSRTDLSNLLNLSNFGDRDVQTSETRRETRQEREARRLERDRLSREKERERSMHEEHIDGGYLVTQGVYTGPEDYSKFIVRRLMIERRLAPFWRGLQDHSDSWAEHQLIAAARCIPIPAADEVPLDHPDTHLGASIADIEARPTSHIPTNDQPTNDQLTVPLAPRSRSFSSEASAVVPTESHRMTRNGSSLLALPSGLPMDPLSRVRAKTLASLHSSSKGPSPEPLPREVRLPANPTINGQPIEAYLYKDASECPICFLYYPPYLNRTRCCDQTICSECFVQIKRPDPHPPEHAEPSSPDVGQPTSEPNTDGDLVSEPATCPFCKQPEFGISYEKPPFRRGLAYANQPIPSSGTPGMSSSNSLASGRSGSPRRRAASLSATAPTVITTDHVRPDWNQKLVNARTHQARRSAAATALHSAAYMMGGRGFDEGRFHFGRRGLLRRMSGVDSPSSSSNAHYNLMSMLSDNQRGQYGNRIDRDRNSDAEADGHENSRGRMEDLEEMMMMEAIRLSLASEDERRKKEDKEAKKEAKRKDKETKKAEKAARKAGGGAAAQAASSMDASYTPGKGKQPQQDDFNDEDDGNADSDEASTRRPTLEPTSAAQSYLERARNQIQSMDSSSGRLGLGSHFHKSSYASSTDNDSNHGSLGFHGSGSSLELSPNASLDDLANSGALSGSNNVIPPAVGASSSGENLFNFSSLAGMIDSAGVPTTDKQPDDPYPDKSRDIDAGGDDQHADSEDEDHYFDTNSSSDVKISTTGEVDDRILHQQPQAS